MIKKKFVLTSDLVKVEPETVNINDLTFASLTNLSEKPLKKEIIEKEQLSLKVSKEIKKNFQVWCVKSGINMTEGLEMALNKLIKKTESDNG